MPMTDLGLLETHPYPSLEDYLNDPKKFQTWLNSANEILQSTVSYDDDGQSVSLEKYFIGQIEFLLPFGLTFDSVSILFSEGNIRKMDYRSYSLREIDNFAKENGVVPFVYSILRHDPKVVRKTTYVPLD